jgi:hypothetical protein
MYKFGSEGLLKPLFLRDAGSNPDVFTKFINGDLADCIMENVQKQWFENKITVIGTEIEKLRKAVNELSAGNEDKLKLLSEIEELQVVFETIKGQKNLEKQENLRKDYPRLKSE